MQVQITAHFTQGYIGHPYWPEVEMLVSIQKESGMNRCRSSANRADALKQHLDAKNMTMAEYEEIKELAQRPFHELEGEIIIPRHHVYGCLVEAADKARAGVRIIHRDNLRASLDASLWTTGKTEPDGIFRRFVVVTGAQGKLSNQRALRENAYIESFDATGSVSFDPETIDVEKLQTFLEYAGRSVGVGACRPLGWGRFSLSRFEIVEDAAEAVGGER